MGMRLTKQSSLKALIAIPVLIAGIWMVAQAGGPKNGTVRVGQTNLCIPEEYAVQLPSEGENGGSNFDTSDGLGINFRIDEKEVGTEIPGYHEKLYVAEDNPRFQSIYVKLSPAPNNLEVDKPKQSKPLASVPKLILSEPQREPWQLREVLQKDDGDYRKWGYCTETSWGGEDALRCMREYLEIGEVRFAYELHEENLPYHSQVDKLLEEKVASWRCDR